MSERYKIPKCAVALMMIYVADQTFPLKVACLVLYRLRLD